MPKKILIVDDDKAMCGLFAKIFSAKYDVISANSGEEAIKLFIKRKPELVITDYHLPGINGVDTITRIKEIDKKCKFILIPSVIEEDEVNRAKKLGVKHIIYKPFKLNKVNEAIKKELKKK